MIIAFICEIVNYQKGIFSKHFNDKIISIDVSGSSKQYINGSKQITKPEYAIYPWEKSYDWCSNCAHSYTEHPWITFSLDKRIFRINKYLLRVGCCYDGCCCEDEFYSCVRCCLYSWALQISDDKKTWKDIHRVDKDREMRFCKEKTYKLDDYYVGKYIRLIQTEPCPGDPPCIAINKIELFGNVLNEDNSVDDEFVSFHDDNEDISIIGHISKNYHIEKK